MESRPLLPPDELSQHVEFLQRIAYALLRDPERAADAVQDTLVRALERPPREPSALRAWLARVLTHRAYNEQRGTRRRAEHELAAARPELGEDDTTLVERLELQRFVSGAVLALPEPRRTVVYLRYYEGLMPQAIAERLGSPVKTVKSHLHRGLGELRAQLDERSGGERGRWAVVLLPLAERALVSAPAATGAVPVGLFAAAALGLAFFAWRWVDAREGSTLAPESSPSLTVADSSPPASAVPLPTPAPARESLASETELATLELHLTWAEDGTPAAGVGTQALSANDPSPRPAPRRAVSDAAGIARFEGLVPGRIELGLDRGRGSVVELAPGETRTLTLSVPDGVDVAGRVVSESGAPVAGATIWIEGGSAWPEPWDAATSAADGSFRLRSLGYFVRLGARAPSHRASPSYTVYDLAASLTGEVALELVLPVGGQPVRGRVSDEHGQPLAGVRVWIGFPYRMGERSAEAMSASTSGPCRVSTDARGEFTSANRFEPGVHDLVVLADGHACFRGTVEVGDSTPGWAEVALAPPATLTGRVLGIDGEPLAGALVEAEPVFAPRRGEANGMQVELRFSAEPEEGTAELARAPVAVAAAGAAGGAGPASGSVPVFDGSGVPMRLQAFRPPAVRATSGADGSFVLGWTSAALTDVRASVPEHPELGRATLRLASGAERCELRLDVGLTLTGRVVDAEGRGLGGYWVQALAESWTPDAHLGANTDAEGAFALYNLPSVPHSLHASGPSVGNWTPSATLSAVPGSSGVEIVVRELEPPSARVTGVLLGADGRVPDARVLLSNPAGQVVAHSERNARTGAFVLGGFPPGRYRVQAITGNARIVAASDFFAVEEGVPLDGVPLDIGELRAEAPGALELTLGGEAMNIPELQRDGFGSMSLVREGERLVLRDLAPGTWWLHMRTPRWFVADVSVEIASGATVELALEPVPAFVTVASFEFPPEADPSDLFRVEVRDSSGAVLLHEPTRVLSSPWARALVLTLPPGPVVLEAWTDAGLRATASFEVHAGDNEVLELALR